MTRRQIHLVNPLWDAAGGSEWRTVELYRELASHADITLWTEHQSHPMFAAALPIRRIDIAAAQYPTGGTLVFVGVYQEPGDWLALARPRRSIVIYNTPAQRELVAFMRRLFAAQIDPVEIVYASEALQEKTKLRGVVQPSPIDLDRFTPRTPLIRDAALGAGLLTPPDAPFVVGRHSREDPRKHHRDDLALYRQLAAAGCHVRIMGGTCLAEHGPIPDGVSLLPVGAETPETFLHSLDCFLYRTSDGWFETFGRVVHEAMACGLPVVCHRHGGFATSIDHSRTGFLFDTNDEAASIIHDFLHNPSHRARLATSARQAMETMYSPQARAAIIRYYLQ